MSIHAPLVSCIIPTFNRANSIRAAINSAVAQSGVELEVVVVDDCSADATVTLVEAIGDTRVRLIRREQNGGASAARNTGIRAAKGRFIAFLDSDDEWLPGKLDRQLELLMREGQRAAISCTGVEMHLLDHGLMRVQYFEDTPDWKRRLSMGCDFSPGSTQVSHRSAYDLVGPLDETLARFEDWDWLLRYTRTETIAGIRDPLARVYNRRARLGDVVECSARLFLEKHAGILYALPSADRRKAISDLWLQVTGTYAFEGRLRAALPSIAASASQRPLHTLWRLAAGVSLVVRGKAMQDTKSAVSKPPISS